MQKVEFIDFRPFKTEGFGDLANCHCKGIYGLHPAPINGANIKWVLEKGVQDPKILPWFVVCLMFDPVKRANREFYNKHYDPENHVEYDPVNIMTDLRQWAIIEWPREQWFKQRYYLVQLVRDELLDTIVSALGPRDVELIREDCERFVDSLETKK